jgi:ABC-2 type transport system ATP-binding protein
VSTETGAVELRGVTVYDGRAILLDSLDLSLASGQSFAVVGPHSRERSALLRVVAGLRRPTAGQVRVAGWNIFKRPDQVRRAIGFVPDEPGLADRLTPHEHLALVASLRGLSAADGRSAAEAMLELVDLTQFANLAVATLSRGQQRRLAMALALVHDPPIILLDEPFDGVDETGRAEIASVLLELRAMAKTLLIATQSPNDVADVCDIVAPIEAGRLTRLSRSDPTSLVWIEVVSDVGAALRFLREQPGVADIRSDGSFVTFSGVSTAEERSGFLEALVRGGIHVSGFGTTAAPAGGAAA